MYLNWKEYDTLPKPLYEMPADIMFTLWEIERQLQPDTPKEDDTLKVDDEVLKKAVGSDAQDQG